MRAHHRPGFGEHPSCADAGTMTSGTMTASVPQVPVAGWFRRVGQALATRRQRRALMALDDRMLADIGLSRSQAYREAHRGFLDVPPSF